MRLTGVTDQLAGVNVHLAVVTDILTGVRCVIGMCHFAGVTEGLAGGTELSVAYHEPLLDLGFTPTVSYQHCLLYLKTYLPTYSSNKEIRHFIYLFIHTESTGKTSSSLSLQSALC